MVDNRTPVLLIGFNRPDFLAISLKELAGTGRDIYIAIDGPRDNSDLEEVIKSRQLAKEFAEVNCELQNTFLLFREKNLGCKVGVRSAIDWIFEHEEQAIILEDDIVFGEEFLATMDSWLNLFRDRKDIFHLNGFNPLPRKSETDESYLSRYTHVWGWATWRDRWAHYDRDLEKWDNQEFRSLPGLVGQDLSEKFFEYWGMQIALCQNGFDTWDIQWLYSQWHYGGFSLTPGARLTGNRGFDARATHTQFSGNPHRKRLPAFYNYKFLNPVNPFMNLQLNEIHDAIEHKIYGKQNYINSASWKFVRLGARIFLKMLSSPFIERFFNYFRTLLFPIWKVLFRSIPYFDKLIFFIKKLYKYIYWRIIRALVVILWKFISKVFKYIYWRIIRKALNLH
jgi:hypothetical protein